MNKSDLIAAVAEQKSVAKSRAEAVVNCIFDAMTDALKNGDTDDTAHRAAQCGGDFGASDSTTWSCADDPRCAYACVVFAGVDGSMDRT